MPRLFQYQWHSSERIISESPSHISRNDRLPKTVHHKVTVPKHEDQVLRAA